MLKIPHGATLKKVFLALFEFRFRSRSNILVGDVVLEIDGYSVENNGTVKYYPGIRTDATVIVMEHFVGDLLSMKILRNGEEQTISFPLKPLKDLIPLFKFDVHPRYFVYCGLVFQPVSLDLLHALYSAVSFEHSLRAPILIILFLELVLSGTIRISLFI